MTLPNGSPVSEADGIDWSFTGGEHLFDYLNQGESLELAYTLQVVDNDGLMDVETVVLTINGKDDAPNITSINSISVMEVAETADSEPTLSAIEFSVSTDLFFNDVDDGDTFTAHVVGVDATGTLGSYDAFDDATLLPLMTMPDGSPVQENTFAAQWNAGENLFDYLNDGESVVLTYTIEVEDSAGLTDTGSVTVLIEGKDDAPDILAGASSDLMEAAEDAAEDPTQNAGDLIDSGALAFNDVDDGDTFTANVFGLEASGALGSYAALDDPTLLPLMSLPAGGPVTEADGIDWFFSGGEDLFDYLNDGESLTLTYWVNVQDSDALSDLDAVAVTIHGKNDSPVISVEGRLLETIAEDSELEFSSARRNQISIADVDDANLVLSLSVMHGSLHLQDPSPSLLLTGDGTGGLLIVGDILLINAALNGLTYVPALDYSGPDTLLIQTSDGGEQQDFASININVASTDNDPPIALDDELTIDENTPFSSSLRATDPEGDALTYHLVDTSNANGNLFLNETTGQYGYSPNQNFSGEATFTFKANDGSSDSNIATVTIHVTPVNSRPNAVSNSYSTSEEAVVFGNVINDDTGSGQDNDVETPNDQLTVAEVNGLPANVGAAITLISGATLTVLGNGDFAYDPTTSSTLDGLSTGQLATDSFTYRIVDGEGAISNVATAQITIFGNNDAPQSGGDTSAVGTEDEAPIRGIVPAATDAENGPFLHYFLAGPAPRGVSFDPDGSFSVWPSPEDQMLQVGESRDVTFSYAATDGELSSEIAHVTVTINGVNDAPMLGEDPFPGVFHATGFEDDAMFSGVLPPATDVDNDDSSLQYFLASDKPNVTVHLDGTFSVTPLPSDQALAIGETREFTFDYVVYDGVADSIPGQARVSIIGENDAPTAIDDAVSTNEDSDVTFDPLAPNPTSPDSDPDTNDLLSVTLGAGDITSTSNVLPSGAVVTLNENGTFTYDPNGQFESLEDGEVATDSFTYAISDGNGGSDTATVSVTITGTDDANTAPVSGGDLSLSGSKLGQAPVIGRVPAATDSESESGALTYRLVGRAPEGVVFNSDGTFSVSSLPQDLWPGNVSQDRVVTFEYVASDGVLDSAPATVTVTFAGVGWGWGLGWGNGIAFGF